MWSAFASLRGSDSWEPGMSVDWPTLVTRLGEQMTAKVEGIGSQDAESARRFLAQVARCSFDDRSSKFRVARDEIQRRIPSAYVGSTNPRVSPHRACVDAGVLIEGSDPEITVSFRLDELGSYFLSFSLEQELRRLGEPEQSSKIAEWIELVGKWDWIVDSLLLLVARQTVDEPLWRRVIDAMCDSWSLNHDYVFARAPSTVVPYLLEVRGDGSNRGMSASRGLRSVAVTPRLLPALERALKSSQPEELAAAARLIGQKGLVGMAPDLLHALDLPVDHFQSDGDEA